MSSSERDERDSEFNSQPQKRFMLQYHLFESSGQQSSDELRSTQKKPKKKQKQSESQSLEPSGFKFYSSKSNESSESRQPSLSTDSQKNCPFSSFSDYSNKVEYSNHGFLSSKYHCHEKAYMFGESDSYSDSNKEQDKQSSFKRQRPTENQANSQSGSYENSQISQQEDQDDNKQSQQEAQDSRQSNSQSYSQSKSYDYHNFLKKQAAKPQAIKPIKKLKIIYPQNDNNGKNGIMKTNENRISGQIVKEMKNLELGFKNFENLLISYFAKK